MIVTDAPDIQYAYRRNYNAADALALVAEVESLDPSTVVGFLSGKLQATRGVWLRVGRYRIASGSFIDPSDLMLYVASYYEPDDAGAVEAVELNHGDVPDGAFHVETLDELLDTLAQLDLCSDSDAGGKNGDGPGDDTRSNSDGATDDGPTPEEASSIDKGQEAGSAPDCEAGPPTMPSRLEGMTALEPSAAHEMHGALVKGWHAMYYEAPDGSSLLVFD